MAGVRTGKVIFIPSADTPHKDMHHIDKFDRYNMVKEAIKDNPRFSISPVERDRSGPSYTVDTIHILKEELGSSYEFYFICGTDALADLPTWKYNRELLSCCHFICASGREMKKSFVSPLTTSGNWEKRKSISSLRRNWIFHLPY